jgi:hypothetical protein
MVFRLERRHRSRNIVSRAAAVEKPFGRLRLTDAALAVARDTLKVSTHSISRICMTAKFG